MEGTRAISSRPPAEVTVQHLHRTVKDYLESPKIWNEILAVTDAGYSPNLALSMSFVILLKTLSLKDRSLKAILSILSHFLLYAHRAQDDCQASNRQKFLIELLDEVDFAASKLLTSLGKESFHLMQKGASSLVPEGTHWIYTLLSSPSFYNDYRHTFLSLAVRLDLVFYVRYKISKGGLVKRDGMISSLSAEATQVDDQIDRLFDWCAFPSPRMVECLFEHEADPNWKISRKHTVWTLMLSSLKGGGLFP